MLRLTLPLILAELKKKMAKAITRVEIRLQNLVMGLSFMCKPYLSEFDTVKKSITAPSAGGNSNSLTRNLD